VLGVGFGLAVIIGNTIGAGIVRAPGTIALQLPHPWLFLGAWLLGGVYALLGAISLAELGAMIPRSGGQYVFARYALGEYAGFIVGWSDWLSTCGSAAAVSLVIGEFAGALFPALKDKGVVIAATIAIVFAALQWRGIVWGSVVQNSTSLLKALAFLLLIAAALFLVDRVHSELTRDCRRPQVLPCLPPWCYRCNPSSTPTTAGTVSCTFLKKSQIPDATFLGQ